MTLIKTLQIGWLSPQRIKSLSFGNIANHKTINPRTWKPELGGLFDPRIFGPFLNYECYCGKYKGKQNKGQKCERCEVIITEKNVQRWRPGDIQLTSPVTNMLMFRVLASRLGKLLQIPPKKLEDIIYYRVYIVLDNGLSKRVKKKDILSKRIDSQLINDMLEEIIIDPEKKKSVIEQAKELQEKLKTINRPEFDIEMVFLEDYLEFIAKQQKMKIDTGSEAFQFLLRQIDLVAELKEAQAKKQEDKIRFIQALQTTKIQLEWMVTHNLIVVPCGLRPAVKLVEENMIADTQLNNFYRRIILIDKQGENYLKLNQESRVFPQDIIHNSKRRKQKAFEKLVYGSPLATEEAKSLLKILSGKEGILRRYSLGKRVDYSGRAVIIPNPHLSLGQVGLPVEMALILYKPFLLRKILKEKLAFTIKEAEQMLLKNDPVIFSLLDEVITHHPILINRAPTLHRLSIQGFYPRLTLGKVIELHPLVTTAFNADFDGDQMAAHLPLTAKACQEVEDYMLTNKNINDPKNGFLISMPSKDIILGLYYLTGEKKTSRLLFYDELGNIWRSYEKGYLTLHDLIVLPAYLVGRNLTNLTNKFLFTTLGKLIFNQALPASFPYYLNSIENYLLTEQENLAEINEMEEKWKKYIPTTGWKKKNLITFFNNLVKETPQNEIVIFLDKLKKISFEFVTSSGISISPFELWGIVNKQAELVSTQKEIQQITDYYQQGFYSEKEFSQKKIAQWVKCKDNLETQLIKNLTEKPDTSFYCIWDSGARTSSENLTQIFAMRGNATNYLGEIIETPILSSLWEGLNPIEFFISVYGAIKGVTDLALRTAEAGYLTRRLVEASQGVIITEIDCQTRTGMLVTIEEGLLSWTKRVYGRYLAQDTIDLEGSIIFPRDTILWEKEIEILQKNKISSLQVRSVMGCELEWGVCQKCYGADLSQRQKIVSLGAAVGIVAAQSLGEPGTQLTMRTFHTGGIMGEEDIIQGLPKVKQILDVMKPKKLEKAILAQEEGVISDINEEAIKQVDPQGKEITYSHSERKSVQVKIGEKVAKGAKLTLGKIDLEEYLTIVGREICQNYIKDEVQQVYYEQGIDIDEKHFEIFARQMLSKVEIVKSGDSNYLVGDTADYQQIQKINDSLLKQKKNPIQFKNVVSNLKNLASRPNSFLAGISFQNTLKSLIDYSLHQPIDYLRAPKENLIAGQLVPVGTGFKEREKYWQIKGEKTNDF